MAVATPTLLGRPVWYELMTTTWTARLGGRLADPIKTTNVQQMRAMTTWVVEKPR